MENNLTNRFRSWLLANFKPGDRLPDEFELAERFSVARTTIRETISHFQELGVLKRNPRRGTFVSCPSKENISNTLQTQLQFYNYGFEEIKQTRLFLEMSMASQLVAKITPQDVDHLAALIEQMNDAEHEPEKADCLDLEFHLAMATISGNRILEIFSCIMMLIFDQKYRHRLEGV